MRGVITVKKHLQVDASGDLPQPEETLQTGGKFREQEIPCRGGKAKCLRDARKMPSIYSPVDRWGGGGNPIT